MKKVLNLKYIIIYTIILMALLSSKVQASTGIVSTETLNMRSEPSTSSSVVKLLNAGEEIEIISEDNGWYKVKHGEKEGYVSKEYVKVDEDSKIPEEPEKTTNSKEKPEEIDEPEQPTVEKPITTEPSDTDVTASEEKATNNITSNTTIKLEKDVEIRILPLINSHILGNAKSGEEITVIATANNWMFVETNEIMGWIVKDSTIGQDIKEDTGKNDLDNSTDENDANNQDTEDTTDETEDTEQSDGKTNTNENNYENGVTKYIKGSSVYLRAEPSTSSDIVTSLIRNTDVMVIGESGDWYKVKFNDYRGYIRKDLVADQKIEETNRGSSNRDNQSKNTSRISDTKSPSKGEKIVEYAKQYLGSPYVYGGAGSKSFDCSGFTQYVYKNFGYSLSHSATAQSKVGEYVAKEDLQLGDLVFFLDYETMDGIGHCGIYIGDGNFIHASSGTGNCVKISTLLSGSYNNRYATARRLI